jgi:hypothetical protein
MAIKDDPPSKESARRKAQRKWANNDLTKRYKEAKKAHAEELEPPTTVVTIVNPHYDELKELQELVERSRRKFLHQMRNLVNEGREQGFKKYKLSYEAQKRRLLVAKYRLLMAREREAQQQNV